jgi:hypothetical protein
LGGCFGIGEEGQLVSWGIGSLGIDAGELGVEDRLETPFRVDALDGIAI